MPSQRTLIGLAVIACLTALAVHAFLGALPVGAGQPSIFTGLVKDVAVGGYDPVGYFTEGKPVAGKTDITLEYQGATWRFASVANRDAFKADSSRYAPQYGGYCAYAVALGHTAKGDPNVWSIVDGKLYLNFNAPTKATWEKDIPGYIKKADVNWPGVLQK